MDDKEIEKIQTVNVSVTPESVDLHVQIMRENGYNIMKTYSLYSRYFVIFLLGMYIMGIVLYGTN